MRRLAVVVVSGAVALAAACSAFDAAPDAAPASDGGASDDRDTTTRTDGGTGGGADGATPLRAPCQLDQPFGALHPIPGINLDGGKETAGSLTPDELRIFFAASDLTPTLGTSTEIYEAARVSTAVDFGRPAPVATAVSPAYDANASISPDGFTLMFESDRPASDVDASVTKRRLYRATRSSAFGDFGALTRVFATDFVDSTPFLTATGLYFSSRRKSVLLDLFHSPIVDSAYGPPVDDAFAAVNVAEADDSYPVVTADGLTLYFTSNRSGPPGDLADDLFVAHRQRTDEPFGAAVAVEGLAEPGRWEIAHWVTPDGCRLYVTVGKDGDHDSFYVEKPPRP